LRIANVPGAFDQLEFLENGLNRFQVVVGVHVQHGVVLVIELTVRFSAGVVTFDQVFEVIVMALQVTVRVHGHEAGVLQEARIDAAAGPREIRRHTVNHIVLKPAETFVHRQVVDRRRRACGIDRAAHHGHAQRRLFATRSHQGDGGQHGHRGLTNAHHMAVAIGALQMANELLYVVDVVVKVKLAIAQRHQAGIFPVGDVDLVARQHGLDSVSQQGGIVA